MRKGKIQIKRSRNGQWFFRFKAGNGKIIFPETYKRKASALKAVDLLRHNSVSWPLEIDE